MSSENNYGRSDEQLNELNEPGADYEKAITDLLRERVLRSYTQRFEIMMQLIKTNIMLKNAKVIHKKYPL
jgi:hypothetical protein